MEITYVLIEELEETFNTSQKSHSSLDEYPEYSIIEFLYFLIEKNTLRKNNLFLKCLNAYFNFCTSKENP